MLKRLERERRTSKKRQKQNEGNVQLKRWLIKLNIHLSYIPQLNSSNYNFNQLTRWTFNLHNCIQ